MSGATVSLIGLLAFAAGATLGVLLGGALSTRDYAEGYADGLIVGRDERSPT